MNYFWSGPVNLNWGPGLVKTDCGPGTVNTNWGPGPGTGAGGQQRAGGRETQRHILDTIMRKC